MNHNNHINTPITFQEKCPKAFSEYVLEKLENFFRDEGVYSDSLKSAADVILKKQQ